MFATVVSMRDKRIAIEDQRTEARKGVGITNKKKENEMRKERTSNHSSELF